MHHFSKVIISLMYQINIVSIHLLWVPIFFSSVKKPSESPNLNDQLIETSGIQSFAEDEPGSFGIYQPGYWLVNTRSMKLV